MAFPMRPKSLADGLEDDVESNTFISAPGGGLDFCSREGAQAIKARIEAYWAERGHDVMVVLENVGFHPAIRAARYDIRSDMIDGRPRARRAKPAGAHESDG